MAGKFRGAARVEMAPAYQQEQRRIRRPQHPFYLSAKPFVIQPFFLAPVLPNETLTTLLHQSRVVTDPIKAPLIGWWCEYYYFYIKLTDLDDRDTIVDMMTKATAGPATTAGASNPLYRAANSVDWMTKCLKRVTEEYFRNEGEAWDAYVIDGLPVASVKTENWANSLIPEADLVDDVPEITVGVDDKINAEEINDAMTQWQLLKGMNLTDMTFDDYLRTFGIKTEAPVQFRPELVRFISNWTFPTNVVNPATGVPASAASWTMSERGDKNRFFKEPGFLFGVTVTRPKIYFKNYTGSLAGFMQSVYDWFPAVLHGDDNATLKNFAEGAGPLPTFDNAGNNGYVVDMRDLLIYGDQFTNVDRSTTTDASLVGLPLPTGQRRYVTQTDLDGLFTGAAGTGRVRHDGLVSLHISGRQTDRTPGVPINI